MQSLDILNIHLLLFIYFFIYWYTEINSAFNDDTSWNLVAILILTRIFKVIK